MEYLNIGTAIQLQRLHYLPKLPPLLTQIRQVGAENLEILETEVEPEIRKLFPSTCKQKPLVLRQQQGLTARTPKRVGVVFSGGQASGGHNVISGLYDALLGLHHESRLFGFLGGPSGILNNQHIEITRDIVQRYRNQGGFDMLGSGRTKIDTIEQFENVAKVIDTLQLNGIVVIGGDDSNTNAALLAEYLKSKGLQISIIGVPKTIDGDLKNEQIEISFGFDTATKTFSDTIGNIARDALSAKKYYHFIRLMGRSASHIALECALQTHSNITLIGEEIQAKSMTFQMLVDAICDGICRREAEKGKNYGVILLPEGVIEFIPEFKCLIEELNKLQNSDNLEKVLSSESYSCFSSLPSFIKKQLLMDRDPHGNVQVSKIETERLFISAVTEELERRKQKGRYKGKFNPQPHFLGYEGRCAYPSNFDAKYCYALGHIAALLIQQGLTSYMCTIKNLGCAVEEWECRCIPLVSMMGFEERQGKAKPVIRKALLDLKKAPFRAFEDSRDDWLMEDSYCFPGPIQFNGLPVVSEAVTLTLSLEQNLCVPLPY